jgi:predicted TIM-barrel fold metal-dependent hydrolase
MGAIDIHTHLPCRREVADQRIIRFVEAFGQEVCEERPVEALLAEMDSGDIEWSVVQGSPIQAGFLRDNVGLAEALRPHRDRLIGFGTVDPFSDENAADQVRRCVEEYGFRGIGEFGCLDITDPACYPVYETCIEQNIPILIHLGAPLPTVPLKYCHPNLLDEVVIRYPELKVIAAHCAVPWFNELATVALRHPNVWIDLSALEAFPHVARMQALLTMIASGLAGRLLFGSDFPVTRPSTWVKRLRSFQTPLVLRIGAKVPKLKKEERESILSLGARQLLKL